MFIYIYYIYIYVFIDLYILDAMLMLCCSKAGLWNRKCEIRKHKHGLQGALRHHRECREIELASVAQDPLQHRQEPRQEDICRESASA